MIRDLIHQREADASATRAKVSDLDRDLFSYKNTATSKLTEEVNARLELGLSMKQALIRLESAILGTDPEQAGSADEYEQQQQYSDVNASPRPAIVLHEALRTESGQSYTVPTTILPHEDSMGEHLPALHENEDDDYGDHSGHGSAEHDERGVGENPGDADNEAAEEHGEIDQVSEEQRRTAEENDTAAERRHTEQRVEAGNDHNDESAVHQPHAMQPSSEHDGGHDDEERADAIPPHASKGESLH